MKRILSLILITVSILACSQRRDEQKAMDFLYDAMSIADIGDYDEDFFLANVRISLRARDELSWGKDIPEDLFRHFVLPVRVNNERLDSFRMVWYETLRDRVQGMSMHDAALEVNHWCHEKASYVPSDARTSSPLATIRSAEGRCGEESVLAVAAMRTVGIPARQVYTPRWAHTDDNHAWVEVWTDGKWSFLGACEPEPELNMAWFNEPASRAMLMHTLVYGDYRGPEDVIRRTHSFTEINVIGNYVDTRRNIVTVVDSDGNPVEGARVEFCIYNYAEMYPAVALTSDAEGRASLHSGKGDMFVWASAGGRYGFGMLTEPQGEITVVLEHTDTDAFIADYDVTPPPSGKIPYDADDEAVARNKVRLAYEDSLRHAYIATFADESKARASLSEPDEESVQAVIASRGNWEEIVKFLNGTQRRDAALKLLSGLSRKDLRDTPARVLADALSTSVCEEDYVLYPRISNEFLQPYRTAIREAVGEEFMTAQQVIDWAKTHIEITDELNPRRLQMTPAGVLKERKADSRSFDIFTVAALRTYGIPARVDVLTGKPQYSSNGVWVDIGSSESAALASKGRLTLSYTRSGDDPQDPEYYRHFTLSRIENGRRKLLEFDGGDATELGADARASSFRKPFALDEGTYLLTTGTRTAGGKALTRLTVFRIKAGETTDVRLTMRQSAEELSVIGNMDPEMKYLTLDGETTSILNTTGRGYFLVAVIGSSDEPSRHALGDLAALNVWDRPVLLLSPDSADAGKLKLPANVQIPNLHFGIDPDGSVKAMLSGGEPSRLPVIALCDSFGRTVFRSTGYNTSLGAQLSSVIGKL